MIVIPISSRLPDTAEQEPLPQVTSPRMAGDGVPADAAAGAIFGAAWRLMATPITTPTITVTSRVATLAAGRRRIIGGPISSTAPAVSEPGSALSSSDGD